jgi:hypothetical protein
MPFSVKKKSVQKQASRWETKVPLSVVREVLWYYGDTDLGIEPDRFTVRLILLLEAADVAQLAKLAELYPELVAAFTAGHEAWGIEWMRNKAKAAL